MNVYMSKITCPDCNGSGYRIDFDRLTHTPSFGMCRRCGGTGMLDYIPPATETTQTSSTFTIRDKATEISLLKQQIEALIEAVNKHGASITEFKKDFIDVWDRIDTLEEVTYFDDFDDEAEAAFGAKQDIPDEVFQAFVNILNQPEPNKLEQKLKDLRRIAVRLANAVYTTDDIADTIKCNCCLARVNDDEDVSQIVHADNCPVMLLRAFLKEN